MWKVTSDININKKLFGGYIEATVKQGTQEYWLEMLNNGKAYINLNKKRPSQTDKNPKVKKLGMWISRQIKIYKRNINIMRNKKIKKQNTCKTQKKQNQEKE